MFIVLDVRYLNFGNQILKSIQCLHYSIVGIQILAVVVCLSIRSSRTSNCFMCPSLCLPKRFSEVIICSYSPPILEVICLSSLLNVTQLLVYFLIDIIKPYLESSFTDIFKSSECLSNLVNLTTDPMQMRNREVDVTYIL